jgi:hypothetical protein
MTDPDLPCPHCGSTDLIDGSWYIDDAEVDAVECESCKAVAPAEVWNQRAEADELREELRQCREYMALQNQRIERMHAEQVAAEAGRMK